MKKFTIAVENLINPLSTGSLHFIQSFNEKLPISIQKKLINKASKKNPAMGFVVEPYCYFLCYEITNIEFFQNLLPKNFELTKVKIFEDDEDEKYYFILGCFNARTSAFFGSRVEGYAIAKNLDTGLVSWVIIDYDTNTISYDSKNGLSKPTCNEGIITTDFNGDLIVDMVRDAGGNKLVFNSSIKDGSLKKLAPKLWIEGNLSVDYGESFSSTGDTFSLKFDPKEMKEAFEHDFNSIDIVQNNWYREHLKDKPSKLVCFPYAQHFISDAPGHFSAIKNEQDLIKSIKETNYDKPKVYQHESLKKSIMLIPFILLCIIIILFILLIFTNI